MPEMEELNNLFEVDFEKGILTWKIARSNVVKVGESPKHINISGYYSVRVGGRSYLVHRIIWFMKFGECPKYIDHSNGNRLDNRLENLRPATSSQNNANRVKSNNNTSKFKGVYWNKKRKKWHSQIQTNGKKYNLGLYEIEVDAARAYNESAIMIHGVYAKINDLEATR